MRRYGHGAYVTPNTCESPSYGEALRAGKRRVRTSMKIKTIATATLMPATIAGLALAGGTAAHAATHRHTSKAAAHHASVAPDRWVTVQAGDTLSGIAAAHHMNWEAIYATPPNMKVLVNPNLVTVGERLRIPENPRFRDAQFKAKYAARLAGNFASPEQAPASQEQAPVSQQQAEPTQTEQAPAQAQAQSSDGGSLTAGMSSFESCVAFRESTDTPTDPDGLFGILPSTWASLGYSGTAGDASVAEQEAAFNKLYAEDGTQPWAAYDGC
jgi:LysM repeat protein